MKRILIFACLLSTAVSQTVDDVWRQYTEPMRKSAEKCVAVLGLPGYFTSRFIEERRGTEIDTMGCLRTCTLTEENILVNDEISVEALDELIDVVNGDQPEVVRIMRNVNRSCKEKTKHYRKICERVLAYVNCWTTGLDYAVTFV